MATPNTKIVNIKAIIPIRDTTPPIYGVKTNVKMTHSDILKCLCRRAIVDEVLPDGSTVRLNTKNFRDDFTSKTPTDNTSDESKRNKKANFLLKYVDESAVEKIGFKKHSTSEEDKKEVSEVSEVEEENVTADPPADAEVEDVTVDTPADAEVEDATVDTVVESDVKIEEDDVDTTSDSTPVQHSSYSKKRYSKRNSKKK